MLLWYVLSKDFTVIFFRVFRFWSFVYEKTLELYTVFQDFLLSSWCQKTLEKNSWKNSVLNPIQTVLPFVRERTVHPLEEVQLLFWISWSTNSHVLCTWGGGQKWNAWVRIRRASKYSFGLTTLDDWSSGSKSRRLFTSVYSRVMIGGIPGHPLQCLSWLRCHL